MEEQRNFFRTGITKKLEHRRQQLIALRTLVEKEERVLTEAVYKDLRRVCYCFSLLLFDQLFFFGAEPLFLNMKPVTSYLSAIFSLVKVNLSLKMNFAWGLSLSFLIFK